MKKKFLSLVLALVMLLSLVACGNKNEPATEPTPDTPPVEDTTPDTPDTPDEPAEVVNYTEASHDDDEIYALVMGEFDEAYAKALAESNVSTRYALMAVAEAKMLEAGIMAPTTSKGGNYAINRLAPYGTTPCLWGNDRTRYYRYIVLDKDAEGNDNALLKDADRVAIKEYWKEVKETATEQEFLDWVKNFLTNEKGYTLKDTYGMAYSDDPQTFDALATYRASDSEVLVNTYDGLLEYNCLDQQSPALAESYEESADGLTYTFHIRQGVVWTDSQGREVAPVTADDWVAALQHALDNPGNLEFLVAGVIKGVNEYLSGSADFSAVGVKAVDEYTLEYTLEQPTSYFVTMLGYGIFAPMCRSFYESLGGTFGPDATSGEYGTGPDKIAYCGPYVITNFTPKNTFVFKANDKYWNKDAVNVKTLTWYFNDGSDTMKSYNDFVNGIIDGCGLNDSNMSQAKTDGNYDGYAYGTSTDATSYMGWFNVNRGIWHNEKDETKAVSPQDDEAKARTHAAMLNQNFRMAICTGFDRAAFNAQSVGEELREKNLINSYVPGTFVSLQEDVTIDLGTFPAGTRYGEILQAQITADGFPMTVWNPDGDDGVGSSSGFDGWYNPTASKEFMDKAVEELGAAGLEISAENPIQIDIPYAGNSEQFSNRAHVFKQSIETNTEGRIQVNLVACTDAAEWNDATYWPESGAGMNGNYMDNSGWSPDFGDPSSYLGTLYVNGDGSMLKNLGLY